MLIKTKATTKTRSASVCLDEDGILKIYDYTIPDIKFKNLKEINDVSLQLCGDKKVPVLNDIRGVGMTDREARQFPSHPDVIRLTKACALLVGSPVSRVIGNFFLGLNQPPYPVKLFSSEEKAIEWLKQFVEI